MSLSNNFPAIKPSLLLDFANTGSLDPRVTFSRASTATYYDGVTTAMAEQNLLIESQELDLWSTISAVSVTANSTNAPDGTATADTLTETTATTNHYIGNRTVSVTAGLSYAFSVFLKKGVGATAPDIFQVTWEGIPAGFLGDVYANFNINAGTVTQSGAGVTNATITSVGNGWYRCSFVATANATASSNSIGLFFCNNNGTATRAPSYAGATTADVYAWGAQLEQRSSATAYTATTTQPITNYIPVLQTAAANVARFDHNPTTGEALGLLVEEQRTNLVTYSSEFDNAAWMKTRSSITANTIVAPDGTLAGDKLVIDTTAATNHSIGQNYSVTSGTTYTWTVYAKASEISQINLRFSAQFPVGNTSFDLSAGTVINNGTVTASAITPIGNDWYRCSFTQTASSSGTAQVQIFLAAANAITIPTANGFDGVFIWGAQLEAGAFPTSYIATTSAQVTRSADAASMTGTNFSSWYRADEGSFYHELNTPNSFSAFANFGSSDGTTNNQVGLQLSTTSQVRGIIKSEGNSSFSANLGNIPSGFYKVALAYKTNDSAICLNAGTVTTDTSVNLPNNLNQLSISGQNNSANGTIKKLAYYPSRLTNAQLQALTS